MSFGERSRDGQFIRVDGAETARLRKKDMIEYILDNPGNTKKQITQYMMARWGLDPRRIDHYISDLLAYEFLRADSRVLKPKDGSSQGVDLGLGYYATDAAKKWLQK